jgi:hypothetical protein
LGLILKYADTLRFDYITVTDWVPVADGVLQDIGIVLRIGRGDILLASTPTLDDDPDEFIQNTFPSGNIFMTTENSVLWIKPRLVNFPVSANGEILYNVTSPYIASVTATSFVSAEAS